MKDPFTPRHDGAIALLMAGVAFLVYFLTLAPGVISLNDDTLEFQLVAVRGAIPHPSGYPLYAILLTLFTHLVPVGEMAWRANLLSAIFAAIAVGITYLAARRLDAGGTSPIGAALAVALFALAPTFWSQATIAEVYALHILIMAALVWRMAVWMNGDKRNPLPPDVLLLMGLGLAHHRMIVLWYPAIGLLWWIQGWRSKTFALPSPQQLIIAILAFVLPLTLYLWLPLRSDVNSIDGTYQQVGFSCWVTACQYTAFFGENALERERSPLFFAEQTVKELGVGAVVLALLGVAQSVRSRWLAGVFLGAAFIPHLLFAWFYRVPDPEVFWLPNLWIVAIVAGMGVQGLKEWVQSRQPLSPMAWRAGIGAVFLLLVGVQLLSGWQAANRHLVTGDPTLNGVPFNGQDFLNQPLPQNGVVVGLLGEITYLSYLQEVEGIAPQIQTTGGDDPTQRAAAIEAAFAVGSRPFLTRELVGLENRYSLSALGPFIEVLESPRTDIPAGLFPLEQSVTDSIILAGWTRSPIANSDLQRLTVAWRVTQPIAVDLQLSVRVVNEGDGLACDSCQVDRPPVRNGYPTSYWRTGEVILDTYELPAPPAGSHYLLIFYLPDTGLEVGRTIITP